MSSEPPFHNIAIVGFGLIGGSIALAVRDRWPSVRITAVDKPAVLAHAAGSGAIDRTARDVSELGDSDLVVLAAPVEVNLRLLPQVAGHLATSAVITDVGSTKRDINRAAAGLASPAFVGGHPIGGAERGGFAFARADLFRGRPWIFTPQAAGTTGAVDRLFAFAQGVGARPTAMDAGEHDKLMAFLSHLPQLTVSALMDVVGVAAGSSGLRLAGRGLVDTTRLAASPPDIWSDVCAANADEIGAALDALIVRLQDLRAGLDRGQTVESIFKEAGRWRAELMKGHE